MKRCFKFSKHFEQVFLFFIRNSHTCINHLNTKTTFRFLLILINLLAFFFWLRTLPLRGWFLRPRWNEKICLIVVIISLYLSRRTLWLIFRYGIWMIQCWAFSSLSVKINLMLDSSYDCHRPSVSKLNCIVDQVY